MILSSSESAKKAAAQHAATLIHDGMLVGLGTGSTAKFFIEALGEKCKNGLNIKAVATSVASANLAKELQIFLVDINTLDRLDITVDGADEIDKQLQMIKGGGGALLREKIVASMSKMVIAIVDEAKVVEHLGKFLLPVEILQFASKATLASLKRHGYHAVLRAAKDGATYVTDNGNFIADIKLPYPCSEPEEVDRDLKQIPGVLETGFFLHMAKMAIVGFPDGHIDILG
jgi:ribose 5-phosphate isomerase A